MVNETEVGEIQEQKLPSAELLDEQKEKPSKKSKAWFGNKDKEKKHDLSALKIPKDYYAVRHFNMVTLPSGKVIEDEGSSRFQVYDQETFENMNRQKVTDGQQIPSQFQTLGLNMEILHDPS